MRDPMNGAGDPVAAEMQQIVRAMADPPRPGESVKSQINRAAKQLDLTARRTESFWYGRGRTLAIEADRLRAALETRRAARRQQLLAELDHLARLTGHKGADGAA